MYDLIDECGADLEGLGYKTKTIKKFGISISSIDIKDEKDNEKLGLEKGKYYILNCPNFYDYSLNCSEYIIGLLSKQLTKLLEELNVKQKTRILIVGLGNPNIFCDRLGKEVFDKVNIDVLNKENNCFKVCPDIYFSTGIKTMDIVDILVKSLKIDIVLLIDSLMTNSISRLGCSFQITTSGITPGSGVNRFGKKISAKNIGVPCISLGVPFMILGKDLNNKSKKDLILVSKDIQNNVELIGYIFAETINNALKEVKK